MNHSYPVVPQAEPATPLTMARYSNFSDAFPIFAEPAAAVALAGAAQANASGELDPDSKIVCLVTGSGFKDASSIDRINADREAPLVDSFTEFESIVRSEI
jgi:threonine synthase